MKVLQSKLWKGILGIIIGFALIFILFVTSFEIACYSDYGFYEREYEKFDVNNETTIVNMEMDELMRVTEEMMAYLHGDREDLVIYAGIDGEEKEMFNDIEKSHMADVREIFLAAMDQRILCILIVIFGVCLLWLTNGGWECVMTVCTWIPRCMYLLWAVIAGILVLAFINFQTVFYAMHYLLFDNDNWLLDPSTSRLINILPEGFFVDMGIRIVIIFLFVNFFILSLAFLTKRGMIARRKNLSGGTYEQG